MKSNLILIGPPGSGKTSIGRQYAQDQKMNFVDFDDHILEKIDLKTAKNLIGLNRINVAKKIVKSQVSHILNILGEEDFLELEKDLALMMQLKNTVLSTSGSLPLKEEAISYLRENGTSVYIDIPQKVILQRMEVMQIDRIIGMNKRIKTGMDKKEALKQVLDERAMAYENCYDYKFHTDGKGTQREIFENFKQDFQIYTN